jgi:hypothetical protein
MSEHEDAEIERLKMNWSWTEDALEKLKGEHRDALKLITELADALEPFKPLTGKEAELLQRAREAAKHE